MARQDRRPPPQPVEDMFGRPTDLRHDKDEQEPTREQQGAHPSPQHASEDESRENTGEESEK